MHATLPPDGPANEPHAGFLSILPRIELHARIHFRHLRCPGRRDDAVAETVAVAWKWYLRLAGRGKDVGSFVTAFATLAARHVRSGRRLCGQERGGDAMSPSAQIRHAFAVHQLTHSEAETGANQGVVHDALKDNTVTPPPDQAAFRIDFPAWLGRRSGRDRRIIGGMMAGGRTSDLSREYGLSPGRISQLRRECRDDWVRFHGDDLPTEEAPTAR